MTEAIEQTIEIPAGTDEEVPLDQRVTLAYVHQNEVTYSWHHSMQQLWAYDMANSGRIMAGGFISMRCGSDGLVEARNQAVEWFMRDHQADWLFWIDTDMGFEPDIIDRLFEAADPEERPIVGALCFSMRETEPDGMGGWKTAPVPTVFDWTRIPGEDGKDDEVGFAIRWDYKANVVTQVSGTGSAAILIHRDAFRKIRQHLKDRPKWYERVNNPTTGQLISEDLSFCLRAGASKIPIYVHTGVRTTHMKPVWLEDGEYWRHRVFMPAGEGNLPADSTAGQVADHDE